MIDMPELSEIVRYTAIVGSPILGSLALCYFNKRHSKKVELKEAFGLPANSNPKYSRLVSIQKAFKHNFEYARTNDKKHIEKVPQNLQRIIEKYDLFSNKKQNQICDEEAVEKFKKSTEIRDYILST